jgi:glycosyltransferase involved in cell wall biosynthesis
MLQYGHDSETFSTHFYEKINHRSDWDQILNEMFVWCPTGHLKKHAAFIYSLFNYDIFFTSFDGFFLGDTKLEFLQSQFFKIARKKVVVIPYGGDAYVYGKVKSLDLAAALQASYPGPARTQKEISRRVDYWVKNADVVISGFMSPDGIGRNDVMIPSPLFLDTAVWKPSPKLSQSDGTSHHPVRVVHAPNHRGFKGSEFIELAISRLKAEGLNVTYTLLEGLQNSEIREVLQGETDILVDQLIFSGHGLNAIEGMASGVPTISNLEDIEYIRQFRRWSYFDECPLVSASPETIEMALRKLIKNPKLRSELATAGRKYVEKYHGFDSANFLFSNVIHHVQNNNHNIRDLYHPILGDYPKREPRIIYPELK